MRVVKNTRYLSELENVNKLVTLPAAWLHDCVQVPKDSPDRPRVSRLAADAACRFLATQDFPADLLRDVHHAIEAHSFSAGIEVGTREAAVVQDADRLDALGAIGIARCLSTGGALGSQIYHPDDPFCLERKPNERDFMVDHFFTKLFTLPDTMRTEAGRVEALRRLDVMQEFLVELGRETGRPFTA